MAVLTPTMPTLDIQQRTGARTGWAFAVAAAIVGPVLFAIGQTLLPQLPDKMPAAFDGMATHRDQLLAARLFTAAGALLFVPALIAVFSLVPARARGSRLLLAGGVALGIGTFCNGLDQAVAGYSTYASTYHAVPTAAGRSVIDAFDHLGLPALPLSFLSIVVFALGMVSVAVALIRSRTLPTWQPVVLLVGALLAFATAGMGAVVALTQLPMVVGFAALGVMAWRRARP